MPLRVEVRQANAGDVDVLLPMIRDLAAVNDDQATITAEQLREDGFGERPLFQALIAECNGSPVGYAFWCLGYNASFGTRFLHLHHLYIVAAQRRAGVGRCLVAAVAREALERNCAGLTLGVVAENVGAEAFYQALGFHRENPPNPRFFISREEMEAIVRNDVSDK
jgi:GNAT superfamily N-acetyltransferase